MKEGLLIKYKSLKMHENPLPISLLTTGTAKHEGKENSSRPTYKNISHKRKQRPKKIPPMMLSMITQPYYLIMGSKNPK